MMGVRPGMLFEASLEVMQAVTPPYGKCVIKKSVSSLMIPCCKKSKNLNVSNKCQLEKTCLKLVHIHWIFRISQYTFAFYYFAIIPVSFSSGNNSLLVTETTYYG